MIDSGSARGCAATWHILRWGTFALLGALCLASGCSAQHQPDDGWARASVQEASLDPRLIGALIDHARDNRFENLHSILIVKDGSLVVEEYFGAFDKDTLHYTASISKSVGSILVGIAMDQGLVPSFDDGLLDMPVAELFPEYEAILTGTQDQEPVRFRHVLSMSAGFEWDEETFPYSDSRNDWIRASQSDDPVKFVLQRPRIAAPGTEFNYNGGLSIMLSYLVQRVSGVQADAFAKEHLFAPLGITDYLWRSLPSGLTDTDGGLSLRPRDMAKIGQLYLNGGTWNGKRIVPSEWVAQASRVHITSADRPDYGMQWWCGDFSYGERTIYMYLASGHGGQKIFVIPSHNMVVVLTHTVFNNPLAEMRNVAMMSRYILPAADSKTSEDESSSSSQPELAPFAGTFGEVSEDFTIELRDGSLYASAEGAPTIELMHVSGTRFRGTVMDLLDVDFIFDAPENGASSGVRVLHGFSDQWGARQGG